MKRFNFLFIILFIHVNSQIKNNPISLGVGQYPFVLSSSDDYYYVITKENCWKILKEYGNITNTQTQNVFSSSEYIYVTDNSNNNYLYFPKIYYEIKLEQFISFIPIQTGQKPHNAPKMKRVGGIFQNNHLIFYGYSNDKDLIFSNVPQKNRNYITGLRVNDNMSCKFIEGEDYICAMINRKDRIIVFILLILIFM